VSRLAFSSDGSCLDTNTGQLDLGAMFALQGSLVTGPQSDILLESSWIKRGGVDSLWLPHEYRAFCHDVYGSILVSGQASGAVSSFRSNDTVSEYSKSGESGSKNSITV